MHEFEPFDLLNSPLEGTNLIEASAGTGKTYTITGLFLRLVLEKDLSARQILVVTFTEAATQELRERIRSRLREAVQAFSRGVSEDPFLRALVARHKEEGDPVRRLREVLHDFDEAAIYTIHGFCRGMLYERAFESGSLFDTELIPDQEDLKRDIIDDFWRTNFYDASPLFVHYALQMGFSPDRFLSLVGNWISRPAMKVVPEMDVPDSSREERAFEEAFDEVRRVWESAREEVEEVFVENDSLNKTRYRKENRALWIRAMDLFLTTKGRNPRFFKGFDKFTAGELQGSVKKGCTPPTHPFFERCETLKAAGENLDRVFSRRLLALEAALFPHLQKELFKRKQERNVQFFDDLLIKMGQALEGTGGERLARTIRLKFKAALIDEFQDTDPVQYAIFKKVFDRAKSVLFLIGDPKQAIYGFRGADIFAYMEASGDVGSRYTLGENWRSEPGLIAAVNTFFLNARRPFVYDGILYEPSRPAANREYEVLRLDKERESPFQIWFMDARKFGEPAKAVTKGKAREVIPVAVAREVSRLLRLAREGRALLGSRPLEEGDIAILVRKNQEALLMQGALADLRIPSVLFTTENLFQTHEALETERLLTGISEPQIEAFLRTALTTDMMGLKGKDLCDLMANEANWEAWLVRFRTYHDLWKERGFFPMFRRLLGQEGIQTRLMSLPDGERRVTNLLHLGEVLHRKSVEDGLNMAGLLKWLTGQRAAGPGAAEEQTLRLESDEKAVKLVTIHKSKGLEYPVVFCPFLWDGSKLRNPKEPFAFHDEREGMRLTLDLGSDRMEENRPFAEKEILAENLRLFYVALTRAKCRCYLVWGRFNEGETSAPAYLFYPPEAGGHDDVVRRTGSRFKDLSDEDLREGLRKILAKGGKAVAWSEMARDPGEVYDAPTRETPLPTCRGFSGIIDRSWRVASFSSLVSDLTRGADSADRDAVVPGWVPEPEAEDLEGIFSFPRGARAGTCLHDIFERLDFEERDRAALGALAADRLRAYGFDPSWTETVAGMMEKVLSVPLDPENGLCLSRIRREGRLNELEFHFLLKPMSPEVLRAVFEEQGGPDLPRGFPETMERLNFSPVKGFMKGFMDLVFEYGGKYFLVDWKSNYLGPALEDYGPEALGAAMKEGFYILQYHIYTLALNEYLALRMDDYDYENHFGGVYYIFLRGVDPQHGPLYGIYRAKPPGALIQGLRDRLIDTGRLIQC